MTKIQPTNENYNSITDLLEASDLNKLVATDTCYIYINSIYEAMLNEDGMTIKREGIITGHINLWLTENPFLSAGLFLMALGVIDDNTFSNHKTNKNGHSKLDRHSLDNSMLCGGNTGTFFIKTAGKDILAVGGQA